jgi:hypothetical protein
MAVRKKAARQKHVQLDPVVARLELLAGLMLLKPDAKEADRIAVAARVGLDGAAIMRIFNKKRSAASMAVSRAKKKS